MRRSGASTLSRRSRASIASENASAAAAASSVSRARRAAAWAAIPLASGQSSERRGRHLDEGRRGGGGERSRGARRGARLLDSEQIEQLTNGERLDPGLREPEYHGPILARRRRPRT